MERERRLPSPLEIAACGAERAEDVHRLTQLAFRSHLSLAPPSGAARETVERVRADLAAGGGAVAALAGRLVGCLRWTLGDGQTFHVRRVAVVPELQRSGVGRALMAWAEDEARRRNCGAVTCGVRIALPANLAFYRRLGYDVVAEHSHEGHAEPTWLALRKPV